LINYLKIFWNALFIFDNDLKQSILKLNNSTNVFASLALDGADAKVAVDLLVLPVALASMRYATTLIRIAELNHAVFSFSIYCST
jgi:hypothetical protein